MRRFVLKVNSSDCPSGRGRPLSRLEWEGGVVLADRPRQRKDGRLLSLDERRDPEAGDQLLIWVNEDSGGGSGLTATARVVDSQYHEGRLRIHIDQVSPFPGPRLDRSDLARRRSSSEVFDELHRSTVKTLSAIDASAWNEVVEAAAGKQGLSPAAEAGTDVTDGPELADAPGERERAWRVIEQRADRGPFRDALLRRHGGRCAVTGCTVPDVLEAAHLAAHAAGDPARDRPENGILLRADIHTLFDLGLMSVEPATRKLWVASRLDGTEYAAMRGRPVETQADAANLHRHLAFARSLPG